MLDVYRVNASLPSAPDKIGIKSHNSLISFRNCSFRKIDLLKKKLYLYLRSAKHIKFRVCLLVERLNICKHYCLNYKSLVAKLKSLN